MTKTTATGGRVPSQPQGGKRATVRTVVAGGIVDELRRAIAKAEKQGTSRYAIAKTAGMRHIVLSRVAEGRAIPRIDTAEKIAGAIGLRLTLRTK